MFSGDMSEEEERLIIFSWGWNFYELFMNLIIWFKISFFLLRTTWAKFLIFFIAILKFISIF